MEGNKLHTNGKTRRNPATVLRTCLGTSCMIALLHENTGLVQYVAVLFCTGCNSVERRRTRCSLPPDPVRLVAILLTYVMDLRTLEEAG